MVKVVEFGWVFVRIKEVFELGMRILVILMVGDFYSCF